MEHIKEQHFLNCSIPSDINEHLPTLLKYTLNCNSVTEFGTRSGISTCTFLYGLSGKDSTYVGVDIFLHENIIKLKNLCVDTNIKFRFIENSDLNVKIENTDLLFIDSWHCYGQLSRELNLHHTNVKKYIIMHDTTIDEFKSEIIRTKARWRKPNYKKIMKDSNFTKYELETGLMPAIESFLQNNVNWKIKERFSNNNGLTVLEKIS